MLFWYACTSILSVFSPGHFRIAVRYSKRISRSTSGFFPSFFLSFFCPPLIFFLPFSPLPSFLFSFSYSFPIPFLPPHSFSSSLVFSSLFCCFFPPFILFYFPGFFLISPSSLFLVVFVLFFPSRPFLFSVISPLCQGGCYKIKAEQSNNKKII